jgi:hypothetical protein
MECFAVCITPLDRWLKLTFESFFMWHLVFYEICNVNESYSYGQKLELGYRCERSVCVNGHR